MTVAVVALGAPAGAQAAYSGTIAGSTGTLSGDDAGDNLVITVSGAVLAHNQGAPFDGPTDFDSANGGVQDLPADGSVTLVVNAGGGDDAVTANTVTAAAIQTLTADGQAGNDVLTGTGDADALAGGDGNDRVVGAPGADDMDGGAGNDVLVWNNGDGSDVMDGDAGNDEIEVNGAPTAGDAFTIDPAGQRVAFARTNLGPFTLDVSAERMTVNGLGGADTITGAAGLAPLILLALNGGVGPDTITGGDGADLISGGEEADALAGAGGDDRLVGDRGDDGMTGGLGDDRMAWNNGDGSDVMDGQEGADTVEVNGAVGAGDAFGLVPNGTRARFDRQNLGLFNLDIGSTEALAVNGLGGDDRFAAAAGTEAVMGTLLLDGGSGNDTLNGGASNDVIFGGSGNDALDGGGGADSAHGGEGDDALSLRDGAADLGDCGAGNDSASADAVGIDSLAGCERVDQAQGADTAATAVELLTGRVRISPRSRSIRVRVRCPAVETGGCRGRLTLRTAGRVRAGRVRAAVVLGSAAFQVDPGDTERVRIRLARGTARLARRGRLSARLAAVSRDAAGNLAESSRRLRMIVRR